MFDGFLSGVFGGLLGPAISKWLGKYVFWKVFTVVMLALYALLILIATTKVGFRQALITVSEIIFTIPGFLAPVGISAALAFCAFLGSTASRKKE